MANKNEIEKFIDEKLAEKTVTLNIGEAQKQIESAALKTLERNTKLLLATSKETVGVVEKISLDMLDGIMESLFKEQIKEIISSKEFMDKFSTESSVEELVELGKADEELKRILKLLQKLGIHIEVKKVQID